MLRFRLLGANPRPQVVDAGRQQATVNYFSGADSQTWQRGIPTYAQVSYAQIYAGVDLRYFGNAIALDPAGDAYVTGSTASAAFNTPVFPLKGALQGALGGNRGGFGMLDAFVAKVNSCGSQLLYSSYLGGTFVDGGQAIAVDGHGNAYIAGQTLSPNFPLSRPVLGGAGYVPPAANAFVAKISGSPGSRRGACPMALTLDVLPQASSTSPLTVTVHTSPHARVTVTLEVTNTVPPPATAPAPGAPKPPKLGALLYRISMHGAADSYGLY